jgi:PAS domain S-box-containing protein
MGTMRHQASMPGELHIVVVTRDGEAAARVQEALEGSSIPSWVVQCSGAADLRSALARLGHGARPRAIVLIDAGLARSEVGGTTRAAVQADPDCPVVVFGDRLDQASVASYLDAGARDFVPAGELPVLPALVQSMLPLWSKEPGVDTLERWQWQDASRVEWALWRLGERVFVKDDGLRFVFANEAFARDRGCTPRSIIGKTDRDFFPPELADRFQAEDRGVLQTGEAVSPDPAAGAVDHPYASWWKVPIKGPDGRPVAVLGVCGGIYQERRDAEMLSHWASLVVSSPDPVMRLTPTGFISQWNDGASRTYGYSVQEVVGRRITDLAPAQTRDALGAKLAVVRRGRTVSLWETQLSTKHGAVRDVSLSLSPVVSDRGMLVAVSAVGRDITRRKEAERALRESEERFRRLVKAAFDGISMCKWDPVRNALELTFCNDRFVAMSGYTRGELLQAPDLARLRILDGGPARAQERFVRLLKGLPCWGTGHWNRPDGAHNAFEFSATSAHIADEHLIMSVDRDTTEHTAARRHMEAMQEELEALRGRLRQATGDRP